MVDWKKIKCEYVRGGISFRALAEKYGVSFSSVKRKASTEKWTDLRAKSEEKSTTKIIEQAARKEASRVDKFQSICDILMDKIEQHIKDETFVKDAQSTRQTIAALKDLREIKGYKSEADMREQLARIKKLEKEAAAEGQNKEINVVISADLAEYGN